MSFPTDWDVEKYRVGYESGEHWELRKRFLLKHKNKYPEDKLICLAQVFYNVEFLGCRYPKATMKIVEKLSEGIVEEHREKMKGRLQRTFVGASDAASSKVKGLKRPAAAAELDNKSVVSNTLPSGTSNQQPMQSNFIKFESAAPVTTDIMSTDEPPPAKKKKKKKKKSGSSAAPVDTPVDTPPESYEPVINLTSTSASSSSSFNNAYKGLILFYREQDNYKEKLYSSCAFSKIPFEFSTEFQEKSCNHKCYVKIHNATISEGTGMTSAHAQEAAAKNAVTVLSKQCYTILVKQLFVVERKIERHEVMECSYSVGGEAEVVQDDKASRMMKMMGWSGGGLGKEEQGRTEPVMAVHQSRRAGVGSTAGQMKFRNLKTILLDFITNGSTHDIVFSTDFDNTERKEIHTIAHRLGLKSVSRSKGDNRFLTVSRKWQPQVLLSVLKDAPNKSEKYKLIPPNSVSTDN